MRQKMGTGKGAFFLRPYYKYSNKVKTAYYLLMKGYNKFKITFSTPINLSIHACDHCNLNCAGCTPYSPIAEPQFCDLGLLEISLQKLKIFEKSLGTIKIVGGEPLLNPDLSDMMRLIRKYLPLNKIILWTNGINLINNEKMPKDFWSTCIECDIEVWLTKYPINFDYDTLEKTLIKKNVKYKIPADKSIRWTIMQHYENGNGSWLLKSKILKYWKCPSFNCMHLNEDKIFPCAQVAFIQHLNKKFGTHFIQHQRDYIKLDNLKKAWQLRKLMLFATPFCQKCGARYQNHDWQVSKRDRKEWLIN